MKVGVIMIIKTNISWNENYTNDGILYFAQRIVEMLDYRTIDIYRAPLFNTPALIEEYITVHNGAAKEYNLEEIFHETVLTFKNDIILIDKYGQDKIDDIINKLNSTNDRISIMKYLYRTISAKYLNSAKDYLMKIVKCAKEKTKIERAIRCFVPELLRSGYKRDDIYQRAKKLLFSNEPIGAFQEFIDFYDKCNKEYTVYFGLYNSIVSFKDILSKRLNINAVKDNGHLKTWDNYYEFYEDKIKALDAVAAADKVKKQIELFTNYYQFFGNYSGNLIQKNAIVISNDGKEHKVSILCDKYNSIEENDKPQIGEFSEKIVTCLVNGSRCSIDTLNRVTKLHNRAISNNGLQNGFLNLWSILEVLCVTNENSKISQVISKVSPILQRDYFVSIFQDICDNLKSILTSEDYDFIISKIEEGKADYEKIAVLLLIPSYDNIFDTFIEKFINYPVLRSRMTNIHDDFSKSMRTYSNSLEHYNQRIIWHLYRIYRVRNSIVHNGKKPNYLKDIGEHLHSYVDSVMTTVIFKLSIMGLCEVSNVFISNELELDVIKKSISKDVPFDYETIELLFNPDEGTMNCFE